MVSSTPQRPMTGAELRVWAKETAVPGRSNMKVDQLRELHDLWLKTQRSTRVRFMNNEEREKNYKQQCPGRGLSSKQRRRIRKNRWRNEDNGGRKHEGDTLGYLPPIEQRRGADLNLAVIDEVWNVTRNR